MKELPDAVYIVDPRKEKIAVAEAKKLEIPIISIVDTNCDPDEIDHTIPGNDDAIRAVKLITSIIANAVIEGKQSRDESLEEEMAEAEETELVDELKEPLAPEADEMESLFPEEENHETMEIAQESTSQEENTAPREEHEAEESNSKEEFNEEEFNTVELQVSEQDTNSED